MSSSRSVVLIVGAGVAGLSAARRLEENSVENFLLLEGSQRAGGRVSSQRLREEEEGEEAPRVELGAQWIHGEKDNVVHEVARALHFLPPDDSASVEDSEAIVIDNEGRLVRDEGKLTQMMMIISSVEEEMAKLTITELMKYESLEDFYKARVRFQIEERGLQTDSDFEELSRLYLDWYGQLQGSINGWDWKETAAYQNWVYRECEGNETTTLKPGLSYQQLIERYAGSVLEKVKFDRLVTRIELEENQVRVRTSHGEEFLADYAIITLPLGVLKADHAKLFRPALPDWKQKAINEMGFGANVKIFLIFETKISQMVPGLRPAGFNFLRAGGGEGEDGSAGKWSDGVFGFYPDQSDPFTLVAWLSGAQARQAEELGEDEVLEEMSDLVARLLVPAFPQFQPPRRCLVTSWSSSPLTRGSYSYLSPATPPGTPDLLARPVSQRLLWAGEASHPHYFSTVHGAMESGWREADRIRDFLLAAGGRGDEAQ